MTKENVKVIQTALWTALVLAQMSIVGALEVRAETVRKEVMYEAVEGEAELPDEIMVSVLAGNDEELVRCRAVEQTEADVYWQDDFSFRVTFYEYGAGEYQLGEETVKEADLNRVAERHGAELLESMGLSAEEYQVETLAWTGPPYENEDGILCRDAVAYGSRLLRDYRVLYEGVVEPERWQELKKGGALEESWEEPIPEETEPEASESEEETPEESAVQISESRAVEKQEKTKLQEFLEKVSRILLIAVGIGAVFFFGGLFVLALLWIYRKLREWYRNR